MSYANKFYYIAICESNYPNQARGAAGIAEIEVMGAIGQISNTRDEFIRAGLGYVEKFKEMAADTIEAIEQDPDHNHEIVLEIHALVEESVEVSFVELFDLLATDWDERN